MKLHKDKLAMGTKVAPAVGLLLFGEQALAQGDFEDDAVSVPEPSMLALFAAGAAAAGVAHAIKKRRKK
jgi:hypothetical protein